MTNMNLTEEQQRVINSLQDCNLISDEAKSILRSLGKPDMKEVYESIPDGTIVQFTVKSSIPGTSHSFMDDSETYITVKDGPLSQRVVGVETGTRQHVMWESIESINTLVPKPVPNGGNISYIEFEYDGVSYVRLSNMDHFVEFFGDPKEHEYDGVNIIDKDCDLRSVEMNMTVDHSSMMYTPWIVRRDKSYLIGDLTFEQRSDIIRHASTL